VRFLPALRRGNVHGALDMGLAPGILPGRVSREDGSAWFADGWGGAPEGVSRDTTEILHAASRGDIKALVLIGADPVADFPDRKLATAAVEGVASLIAVDCFLTESSRQADVFLPALTFAERTGTTTNLEGRISRLGKKVTGPGVAWQDWVIANELAFRLGADLGFEGTDSIWDEIERLAPSHAGITRDVLNGRPARDGVVAPLADHPLADRGPASIDPVATPGLVEVEDQGDPATEHDQSPEAQTETDDAASSEAEVSEPSAARPPLVTASFSAPAAEVPAADAYSLRLVSGRKLYDDGVVVRQSPALRPLAKAACLRVNPYDLDRLGVQTGGQVRLRSPRLTATIEVIADGGVPRGGAVLPFNLADLRAGDLIDVTKAVAEVAIETVR
jgi:NADH-quinone oxidoreductase subunit G